MKLPVKRKSAMISPDNNRVIARFFYNGDERALSLIKRVMELSEQEVEQQVLQILREFSKRHRSITGILEKHYKQVKHLVKAVSNAKHVSKWRKLLIGSYFTMEYALESAALFNPSMVEDIDQSGLPRGYKRVIISLRATGEGHVSSLVFRRAVIDDKNDIKVQETGDQISEAELIKNHIYNKKDFVANLDDMEIDKSSYCLVLDELPESFTYDQIRDAVKQVQQKNGSLIMEQKKALDEILWLADSHTEIRFSLDSDLSERIIFPISKFEKNGIEDARFTRFEKDNGDHIYYGTYTAYDGYTILPKLIETKDFYTFRIFPLHGKYAIDKNLALFPRKVNGKFVMVSRIDGVNNYVMFSDSLYKWSEAQILSEPRYNWELVQVGNGGSPIETPDGWLLITHGVGPVRKYCLGASLLDLNDPSRVLCSLREPLLIPNEDERGGYVPNVVYTCGSYVHNSELIIPYAISDYESSFVTVNLNQLLEELKLNPL